MKDPDNPKNMTFFATGFRPFFLFGPLYGILILSYWTLFYTGIFPPPPSVLDPLLLHKHEMLFGFAGSILCGFLLTAVQNWTGLSTLRGGWLALCLFSWVLGRVAVFFSAYLAPLFLLTLDCLFPLIFFLGVSKAIILAKNLRNWFVPVLLFLFLIANLIFHSTEIFDLSINQQQALQAAQYIVIIFLIIIGNRVIPFFTQNALKVEIKRYPSLDKSLSFLVLCWSITGFFPSAMSFHSVLSLLIAAGLLLRFSLWKTYLTLGNSMLWVLHIGYLFLPMGFLMEGGIGIGWPLSRSLGIHTFMVGALSVMAIGMISRVTLGHTGRVIAADRLMTLSFFIMVLSLVLRVGMVFFLPEFQMKWISISAILWVCAFGIYLARFIPILVSPRLDGKPG